jgi:hypothetical protein
MLDSLTAGLADAAPNIYDAVLAPLGGFLSQPMRVIRLPDEPTTLTLVLIGLGTVGAYVATTRFLRPERPRLHRTGRISDQSPSTRRPVEQRNVPKRGAA